MEKREFLETIEIFLKQRRMKPTAFGIKMASEPSFVFDLRKGRECRENKRNFVLENMKKYQNNNSAGPDAA